jgi:hypothetical protein
LRRRTKNDDLGYVAREEEQKELGQVGEDTSALLDSSGDGAELVVSEDDLGRALGDVGAVEAHRKANVGALESRAVVDW